jgi:SsrA-binding protein
LGPAPDKLDFPAMAQKAKSNGAKSNGAKGDGYDLVVENRKARHDFFIEESIEAGLALTGTEVKSLRAHKANLRDSYARIKNGEAFLQGVHIGAYAPAGQFSHKETRARKLLMHRREIDRLWGRVRERGYSIVPLKIYFRDGRAKVEIALAKGKHLYDKRQAIARKTSRREMERAMKSRNR